MGKDVDTSTDADKPKTPVANSTTDGADSTHVDEPDETLAESQVRLSQDVWGDESIKSGTSLKASGDGSGDAIAAAPVPAKAEGADPADQSADDGLTLTPIQSLLAQGEKGALPVGKVELVSAALDAGLIPELDSTKVEPAVRPEEQVAPYMPEVRTGESAGQPVVKVDEPVVKPEQPAVPIEKPLVQPEQPVVKVEQPAPGSPSVVVETAGDVQLAQAPVATDTSPPTTKEIPAVEPVGDQTAVADAAVEKVVPVAGDKIAAPPRKLENLTDADIEKLRQAVLEADKKAPDSLTKLVTGRGDSLALIGKLATVDMTGKPDVSSAAVESLKAQELKQTKEYNDYLAPGTTRTDLATALISRGDDVSIKEGERLLVEAAQARPDLIFHPNFRAQIMDSYNKMADVRKQRDLPPWTAEIDMGDLTKPQATDNPAATEWTDKTPEHFKAANDLYWNSGVKAAMPEFQKAIDAADETAKHNQERLAAERLELFVGGLTADRAIAQGQVTGESVTEMEKRRVDIWDKQVNNYVEDASGSRARMNVGLAMIASGDPEMLAKGNQQLLDAVTKHPGLVYAPGLANFGNEFTEQLLGAYKAGAENGNVPDNGAAPPAEAQDAANPFAPQENLADGYTNDALSKAPLLNSNTDTAVEGYGWDKATDIGLPIASLALMLYTGRRQYVNYQRNKAAREANFAIEPTERADAPKDVIKRTGPAGEERLEIKGRAKDGQIVAKNLAEGADTSANSKPAIDPPADFNPNKGKFGEYQPVQVDGKKYYLNPKGEAFEHRKGKFHPTDAIRGLTQSEVAGHELKPLASDMQRTSFQNLGRELTPLGTLADGRVVLQNSTTGGAPLRDTIQVPKDVDPFKGEFNNLQHQRLAGRDYFVSADNKVYTFLQPERKMMEVESVVVKSADSVYNATGMPGSSAEERAINKQVNEILEPLRTRLRSGEQVDALTRAEYMTKARDALMPKAKEVAKALGLPESVVTEQTFRFAESNSLASHDPRTGEIKLSIYGDSHLTSLDHEIKHKKQSLDKIAAASADPAGYREAILERSIADIGRSGRRFTDNGIDTRPEINDPKALEQMRKLVRDQVMREYAERGLIPRADAPLVQPNSALPKELIAELGNVETVKREVMRETQNFLLLEKENTTGKSEINEGSRNYVEQKAAELKRWQADNARTADGGALKNNPEVKQMLQSVAIDTLGTHQRIDPSLRPYYKFSPVEIDARKNQVDAAVERLTSELKSKGDTTKLADHPEGKKLIERGQVIELQQKLLGDFQSGDFQEAKATAKELLAKMQAEPYVYSEDVRFMQERGLLSAEQTRGTAFEPLLREPISARDGTKPGDTRLAALETPGFNTPGGENSKLDLARLDATRDLIRQGVKFRADVGQENVYNLLASPQPEHGILAKLKAEGRIGVEWDVFPTEPSSPADRVGADFLLVNRKTGEFHFLDATKNPNKSNVFRMRQDGVILYQSEYFERGSGLIERAAPGEQPTDREAKAGAFKESLESQIYELTRKPADFNLKETPMPDVKATSEEISRAQVDKLISWADAKSKQFGETSSTEPFADMAKVLRKGVQEYQKLLAVKAPSPEFEKSVRQKTQKEIARFVAAKASSQTPASRTDFTPNKNTSITPRNDTLELVDGERIHTTETPMSKMYEQEFKKLMDDPIQLIKQLSKDEILALDRIFQTDQFKGKGTEKLKAEIEAAYKADPRGPVGRVVEKLRSKLFENKSLIFIGGKEGNGPKVIEKNVIESLRTSTSDNLLGRQQPEKIKAPKAAPGEVLAKQVPKASLELREVAGLLENKLGSTPDGQVTDWIKAMVEDATNKIVNWDAEELAKFKEIATKYTAGDPETVRQVHDLLVKAASDGAKPSELSIGPAKPVAEVPSPIGAESLGHFKDLLNGVKGLEGSQYFGEVSRIAKSAVASQITNRGQKLAFNQTAMEFSETNSLKPGESELILRKGNDVIKPISFEGGNGVEPAYITADGTKVPAREVKAEIRIGAGSSKDQVAREGLVRSQQLGDIVLGKAKTGPAAAAQALAITSAFDKGLRVADSQGANRLVAEKVVSLGEFEYQSRRQPVELTRTGVKIGDQKEITFEKLVQDTTRTKRAELERLEKEKITSPNAELDGRIRMVSQQVVELEQLSREVGQPQSLAKLAEAIKQHATPEEVAKLKAERARPGGGMGKAAIARGGAYALVAAFVAATLAGSSSPAEANVPQYAPTSY
ncbi:MAG: hypothetical protein SGJ27_16425 [Candidatus Melainabacteria bacterium]|nr:hypothetical protein [Candidatus Melainabacteria bacterium]